MIGNYSADVLYAGPVTAYPGLFQINVPIPAGYLGPGDLSVVAAAATSATQAGRRIVPISRSTKACESGT